MSFSTRFVYIGIGGTGLKIGKAFERLLREEVCGPDGRKLVSRGGTFTGLKPYELPGFIQTLYIDFSEQDLVSLQSDLLPRSPEVALKTATFVKALGSAGHSSADVTNLLRGSKTAKDATDNWLPPKISEWGNEPTFAPLSTGAGQYPTIGRAAMFAFMERYGAEALLRDFRRPIERIVGSIGQLEEYTGAAAASRNVVFLVGCSLSGGTGGGLFLDVMRLIAHEGSTQLGGTPFVIVPLVLLPSAFDNVLAPSKRKNGSLNAIRALADLGQLIDAQNAPTAEGEPPTHDYPGGSAGTGSLRVVMPAAAVKTAFLFHRPADVPTDSALAERVARFATNLVRQPSISNLASGPLGSGRTMTLLDKLVNNSGLLQERHPTFVGRRPFASAATVAVPDAREQLVHLVSKRLLATFLTDVRTGHRRRDPHPAHGAVPGAGRRPAAAARADRRPVPDRRHPADLDRARGRRLGHAGLPGGDPPGDDQPLDEEGRRRPGQPVRGRGHGLRARGVPRRPRRPVGHARPAHVEHHGPRPGRRDGRRPRDVRALGGGPAGRHGEAQGPLGRRVPVRAGDGRPRAPRCSAAASRRSTPAPSARSGRPRSRRSTRPGAPTSPTPRAPRSSSAPPAGRFGPGWTRRSAASTSGARARPTTRSSTRRPASSSGSRPA